MVSSGISDVVISSVHSEKTCLKKLITIMMKIMMMMIIILVNEKGDVGMVNASLKSTETGEELSTNCNPKIMSRCLSAPDATSLHHCLQNHRQYFTILS